MSAPHVAVTVLPNNRFEVVVTEGGHATTHVVTVSPQDVEHYAPGADPVRLVAASFEFLLRRESKESILRSFELTVIERYFPEYPRVIRSLLS